MGVRRGVGELEPACRYEARVKAVRWLVELDAHRRDSAPPRRRGRLVSDELTSASPAGFTWGRALSGLRPSFTFFQAGQLRHLPVSATSAARQTVQRKAAGRQPFSDVPVRDAILEENEPVFPRPGAQEEHFRVDPLLPQPEHEAAVAMSVPSGRTWVGLARAAAGEDAMIFWYWSP